MNVCALPLVGHDSHWERCQSVDGVRFLAVSALSLQQRQAQRSTVGLHVLPELTCDTKTRVRPSFCLCCHILRTNQTKEGKEKHKNDLPAAHFVSVWPSGGTGLRWRWAFGAEHLLALNPRKKDASTKTQEPNCPQITLWEHHYPECLTCMPRRALTQASDASQMAVRSCPPSRAKIRRPPARDISWWVRKPKPAPHRQKKLSLS